MSLAYARKGLLGVLTPQANTTVEPEFSVLLARDGNADRAVGECAAQPE